MSMHDPVADFLTCIRNAQGAGHPEVTVPASRLKRELARVLKEEGYIEDFRDGAGDEGKPALVVRLKYYEGRPVIERLRRVSRPGLRVFRAKDELPRVSGGYGVAIVSTSRGLMSDRAARAAGHGGEVLCEVS
ncbi:MAG TPA: 30S ribosomal protein S8 [Gammaproteobacteria bacterium]|nr:30S ribosomal protein S8 [Gammaproteobacteria bacterium]